MTECPKCEEPISTDSTECLHCGVVFSKLERRAAEASAPAPVPLEATPLRDMAAEAISGVVWWGRAVFLFPLVIWIWTFARVPMGVAVMDSVLHLPDLVFHESGHVIFSPFGRFMAGAMISLLSSRRSS